MESRWPGDPGAESPSGAQRRGASLGAGHALPGWATLRSGSAYLASVARTWPAAELARALDAVCERAEQAEADAREALLAVVDALNEEDMGPVVQRLREEAAGESLLALERLIRHPAKGLRSTPPGSPLAKARVPDDGKGRPLTLGERKAMARRPDRETMQRLLADPLTPPSSTGPLLRNPRVTEDDILRLAAKRPGRPEVLAEIARSMRWAHRPRIRMALAMNPGRRRARSPARITGLLLRPEPRAWLSCSRPASRPS